jgi:hypothetical protein
MLVNLGIEIVSAVGFVCLVSAIFIGRSSVTRSISGDQGHSHKLKIKPRSRHELK